MSDSELGTRRGPRPGRVIGRHAALPGGRAALGGLLIAIAAVGVFVAYEGASDGPQHAVVVARRDIPVGAVIEAADLRIVRADLPADTRAGTYASLGALVGHVALGPIGQGEIIQAAVITADPSTAIGHEVALTLPRDQIAVGHLQRGDAVDVFVTTDDRTSSVVRGAKVVLIGTDRDRSLTSSREMTIVVAVPSGDLVVALVHALRTGDVTVVRSTFAGPGDQEQLDAESTGRD